MKLCDLCDLRGFRFPYSNRDITSRVRPLAHFFLENAALIDFDLAVAGDGNRVAFQRPRGGAFEIDAVLIKPAAVARAFEFLLSFQPVRRAAEVRTHAL